MSTCPHGLLVPPTIWPEGNFTKYCRKCFLARQQGIKQQDRSSSCIHLGRITGEVSECPTCQGRVHLKVRECMVHVVCTEKKKTNNLACCSICADYQPSENSGGVTYDIG